LQGAAALTRLSALILSVFLALPAAAQDNPIVARMQAFAEAYNRADAAAIAGFYTEKSALFPPQMENVTGREAIAATYAAAFKAGVGNLRFKVLEIRQHGDAAYEIGETLFAVGGRDIRGRYLHVWVQEGGQWMLSRDIYNIIGPVS
jgi:ketosteroid isomerase-like protein